MSSKSGLKKTNNYKVYKHTSPNGKVYTGGYLWAFATEKDVSDKWINENK